MNMNDITRNTKAIAADKELRRTGGSPSCTYKRLSVEAVGQLKRISNNYTAAEWADKLGTSANTIRHRCKALGVTLKPFIRD